MPAVAMTDHGNLFGAIEFYQEALKAGVKPIIGCEMYMALGKRMDKQASSARDAAYHFTLLARDETGYRNLVKLVYHRERRWDVLQAAHRQGGPRPIQRRSHRHERLPQGGNQPGHPRRPAAKGAPRRSIPSCKSSGAKTSSSSCTITASRRSSAAMPSCPASPGSSASASSPRTTCISSSASHHEAHDVMICIGTGSNVADERRMRYVPELYFKSPAEMRELFRNHPEAVENTLRIAERCDLKLEFGKPKYPNYSPPEGQTQAQFLRSLCEEGLRRRYGAARRFAGDSRAARTGARASSRSRASSIISSSSGISSTGRASMAFRSGPGRGSAAGSMVAYVIAITDIDPIHYKLLFERFLNPGARQPAGYRCRFLPEPPRRGHRLCPPEIWRARRRADRDVRNHGREERRARRGARDGPQLRRRRPHRQDDPERVEHHARGRGEKEQGDRPGRACPRRNRQKPRPEESGRDRDRPQASSGNMPRFSKGLKRNSGVHAAGIVISDRDLSEYVPLFRANDGSIVSQYPMAPLGDLGMLKMDFLGLKTLTVIRDAEKLIRERQPDFDVDKIPLDDPKVFELLNRAETVGLFQLDGGMASWCKQFDFKIHRRHHRPHRPLPPGADGADPRLHQAQERATKIKYAHQLLEKVCADTYGIMIYQEQVMAAARVLAGYTLGGADNPPPRHGQEGQEKDGRGARQIRRRLRARSTRSTRKRRTRFSTCSKNSPATASTSATASPTAGSATRPPSSRRITPSNSWPPCSATKSATPTRFPIFVGECKRMGIRILPPDVNRSAPQVHSRRWPGDTPGIRYGLAAIKNVGEAAMEAAVDGAQPARPVQVARGFLRPARFPQGEQESRREPRQMRRVRLDRPRARRARRRRSTPCSPPPPPRSATRPAARPPSSMRSPPPRRPKRAAIRVPPWPKAEKLGVREGTARFLRDRPSAGRIPPELESGKYTAVIALGEAEDSGTVQVAGALISVEKKFTKKDSKPFAIVVLEDLTGSVEVMVWSETFREDASATSSSARSSSSPPAWISATRPSGSGRARSARLHPTARPTATACPTPRRCFSASSARARPSAQLSN